MGAPLHVWQPPLLQSTVGKSVMVPRLVGPAETAESLQDRLVATAAVDAGCHTALVSAQDVTRVPGQAEDAGGVVLASYNDSDQSDLALLSKARQTGIDFILRGEILPDRRVLPIAQAGNHLRVSWRLMPVDPELQDATDGKPSGMPVVVDLEDAIERYPDLGLATDPQAALQSALVRDTLALITPTVQRTRVQLEIPYAFPGSRQIRKGNALARAGRWAEAEAEWSEVLEWFPLSSVAMHNLAIAAVAKQDFSTARRLARKAVRMKPTRLHQKTLVWVEQAQRDYHEAFQLPDPPEGWVVTHSE